MKVRVLTSKAGMSAGSIQDIPDGQALAWLGSGDAELPDAKPGDHANRKAVVERAMANPRGEKTVKV